MEIVNFYGKYNKLNIKEGDDFMTVQTLVYIITTIFTYVLGKISKRLHWNHTLPIQIQNIIIIVIASVVGCMIHIDGLSPEHIIDAVITAVGGVGTAVVAYDAKNQ